MCRGCSGRTADRNAAGPIGWETSVSVMAGMFVERVVEQRLQPCQFGVLVLRAANGLFTEMVAQHELGIGLQHGAPTVARSCCADAFIVTLQPQVEAGTVGKQVAHRLRIVSGHPVTQPAPENRVVDPAVGQQLEDGLRSAPDRCPAGQTKPSLAAKRCCKASGKTVLYDSSACMANSCSPISGSKAWPRQNRFQ